MGRKSYEVALSNNGMDMWKGKTTYVFSNSLPESSLKEVKIIRSMDEVNGILQQPRKKHLVIWWCSAHKSFSKQQHGG